MWNRERNVRALMINQRLFGGMMVLVVGVTFGLVMADRVARGEPFREIATVLRVFLFMTGPWFVYGVHALFRRGLETKKGSIRKTLAMLLCVIAGIGIVGFPTFGSFPGGVLFVFVIHMLPVLLVWAPHLNETNLPKER